MNNSDKNWLFLDFGSSGTKYLAYLLGLLYGGFVPSGVRSLHGETSTAIQYPTGCGVVEADGKQWRVGEDDDIRQSSELKSDRALVKTCAILGSLLGDSSKSVSLVLKLPAREYGRRAIFAREFKEAIAAGVRVNGVSLQAKIEQMFFHVEGSGLAPRTPGKAAAIIVGHTDLSVVFLVDGLIDMGASQTFHGYGMGRLAKEMGLAHLNESAIAYAVMRNDLDKLARSTDEHAEIQRLRDQAVKTYFEHHVREKLSLIDWSNLEACPVGGGGAPLYRAEMPRDILPVPIARPIKTPGLKLFGSRLNSDRFADVYGSALEFLEPVITQKLSDIAEPPKAVAVEVV